MLNLILSMNTTNPQLLHTTGTASSLSKQRLQQRVQEEESERNRQDNLTLNRRLDRLGRETNDLKNSFVSLIGSNLTNPLDAHVNLTHLQTVSALTDKALAVKVKVSDTKQLVACLLFVCMYVCIYCVLFYSLNTDDINYSIDTLSVSIYVCMYVNSTSCTYLQFSQG